MKVLTGWEIRLKTFWAIIWLVGILFLNSIASPWILTAALFIVILTDRNISIGKVLHQLLHVLPFVVLMLVTLSISDGFPLTKEAVHFALLLSSRVVTAVLVIMALTGGSSSEEFIRSLAVFPLPPIYLSSLMLANRYVHLFIRDLKTQGRALKSRLFVPNANPYSLKNTGYVVGGLFIRSFDRSQQVYSAMKSRCFDGVVPCEDPRSPAVSDWIKLVLFVLAIACVIIAERMVLS